MTNLAYRLAASTTLRGSRLLPHAHRGVLVGTGRDR